MVLQDFTFRQSQRSSRKKIFLFTHQQVRFAANVQVVTRDCGERGGSARRGRGRGVCPPPGALMMHATRPALATPERSWEASRAELDRTHNRIASLTAGLHLPARGAAWQLSASPERRPGSANAEREVRAWVSALPRAAVEVAPSAISSAVTASSIAPGETEDAAFWRSESQRMASKADKLLRELELCKGARDAAQRRADEAAAAAETAARACDDMKGLAAGAVRGDGSREALSDDPPAGPAAPVWWARRMQNLKDRVALACVRNAWHVWTTRTRRSYLYCVKNGSLYGASAARVAAASTPRQTDVVRRHDQPERPALSVVPSSPPSQAGYADIAATKGTRESPRWEAKRPTGDDWRPYGARVAGTLSPAEEEQVRSVPEVGVPLTPAPSLAAPAQAFITATERLSWQHTAATTSENSGRSAMAHRQWLGGGVARTQQHPPTSPSELPQTQRWALLHPTHSKDVALAQTAAEHSEMLGAAQRRAEQHLVDVRRRLRSLSD